MPRYVSKGGTIKRHAYQFLDNANCEIVELARRNPDSVKIVRCTTEPTSITVAINNYSNVITVPLHYYLVFYEDGEVSVSSPEVHSAHYELVNPYLKG